MIAREIQLTLRLAVVLAAFGLALPSAFATVLTFEDASGDFLSPLLNYGGFTWIFSGNEIRSVDVPSNEPTSLVGAYNGVGCPTTTLPGTRGCNGAFPFRNPAGTNTPTAITRSGDPFVFDQADLTSLRGTESLTVEGYLAGVLKFTTTLALTINRQTFTFGGPAIDQVRIFQANGTDPWVMDNFQYSAPVPEPGTIALLLAGLVLLGSVAHRRRS
jgi:hypothetical protein